MENQIIVETCNNCGLLEVCDGRYQDNVWCFSQPENEERE